MARKTSEVRIETEGRDFGKRFLLTEMSAADAEAWGYRALSIMLKSGMDIPVDAMLSGMAAASTYGVKAFLGGPFDEIGPLLDRLLACVQIIEPATTRALTPDDIEEILTRIKLRDEVIRLHVNFSPIDRLLEMAGMLMAQRLPTGGTTETSPTSSEPSLDEAASRSRTSKRRTRSKTPTTS